MLYTIAAVLIILWLLGIVMVLVDLISGRRRFMPLRGKITASPFDESEIIGLLF